MTSATEFTDRVVAWYERHGRKDLPWQYEPTPYRVWISEIMLQQTRVTTVIPYFQGFMQRFPDLPTLAQAPADQVLHHWSGLGYYARARNLHQAARQIMEHHGGEIPTALEQLQSLPGIGRSTAGAVLSLACGQRHPILDGNVKRVLTRCFAVPGWPGKAAVQRQLWELAERHTPTRRVNKYNQAMMDLGAAVCTRSAPRCGDCPLSTPCLARQQGGQTNYPQPRPRKRQPVRKTHLLLLRSPAGEVLLERRPPSGIWGGLWSFPECEETAEIERYCAEQFGLRIGTLEFHDPRRHTFSHFHLDYTPVEIPVQQQLQRIGESGRYLWHHPDAAAPGGLAAPVAKLINELKTADK